MPSEESGSNSCSSEEEDTQTGLRCDSGGREQGAVLGVDDEAGGPGGTAYGEVRTPATASAWTQRERACAAWARLIRSARTRLA